MRQPLSLQVLRLDAIEILQDILRFLVPLYNKKTTPSKIGPIAKIKEKLNSFEADFDKVGMISWKFCSNNFNQNNCPRQMKRVPPSPGSNPFTFRQWSKRK